MSISRFIRLFSGCIVLFVSVLGFINFEQVTLPVEAKNEADFISQIEDRCHITVVFI